jgi:hypothetical protein
MVSSDGINFDILTKELFKDDNEKNIESTINNNEGLTLTKELFKDDNEKNIESTINNNEGLTFKMNINSIVPSIDNSKMYIYTHNVLEKDSFITCHSFEKNRISKIVCNDIGFIKTELIKILNKLIINYETFRDGYISIQLINDDNEIIYNTINFYESNYELNVEWNNYEIIESNNYYIQFNMYNCILYSFSYE